MVMRGPGPRSYVPSTGTHAFTRLRFSNRTLRSVARSRTMGNFERGSSRIGCSSLSTSAEQAMRALPLISMAHDPQTSSRQFESYTTGVVGLPSRVTGLRAISIIEEITFIPACQGRSNSSQCGFSLGEPCRRILKRTGLEGIRLQRVIPKSEFHRNKIRREGHEFTSCRFNLSSTRGFQPLRLCLKSMFIHHRHSFEAV